ncbi:hypothetical protein CONLIGDRAFT_202688 [Coniochaeta ligniaria NRRL 30616]|uniref:Uncharacterized protein n=1 Tax=Coniochaeta ligniaria NRRL 30616 TaxID=1408157 RepID=A0A1J7J2G7_9PEZI|nr:hypothetical protein CONLIGDRAFT_202688 [Coniochaeta ligniaria NRRL 30616]
MGGLASADYGFLEFIRYSRIIFKRRCCGSGEGHSAALSPASSLVGYSAPYHLTFFCLGGILFFPA